MKRFSRRPGFAVLLGLLCPGLGHFYWREYLFGLFVFLVMVIASVLVFFSFLVTLPLVLQVFLFGLPALFYVFSFVDLGRAIRRRRATFFRAEAAATAFLVAAVVANLLLPLSPTNFLIRNRPEFKTAVTDTPGSFLRRGDSYLIDRAAYRVSLFFLDEPYTRAVPGRWDVIVYSNDASESNLAVVLGYGGEEVSYRGDSLCVDGVVAVWEGETPILAGEIPLTRVEAGSILVATLDEGVPVGTEQISGHNVVGKVHRLF